MEGLLYTMNDEASDDTLLHFDEKVRALWG
jgi:hypothetical protein